MADKGRGRRTAPRVKQPAAGRLSGTPIPGSPTGCEGWLWWRATQDSQASPVQKDYESPRKVPVAVRAEFNAMRQRYKTGQLRNGANIKNIGDGIYEFKYSHTGNTPYRFLFMRWGKWAVALDVFKKTTNATPKDRAIQRRKAWLKEFPQEPPK